MQDCFHRLVKSTAHWLCRQAFYCRRLVMLALENAFVLTLGASHLITATKIGCALREIAKQRYEPFAVRAKGRDIPHSSSQSCGKHWGTPLVIELGCGPDRLCRESIPTRILPMMRRF